MRIWSGARTKELGGRVISTLRRRQVLKLGALLLAFAMTAALSYQLGLGLSSPADAALQSAAPDIRPITVPVESRQVEQSVTLRAVRKQHSTPVSWSGSTAPAVVTDVRLSRGEDVSAGDVLMTVSGRPVILLPGDFPAYRDLGPGMAGSDVEQFQKGLQAVGYSLGSDTLGVFGPGTVAAVEGLYDVRGFDALTRPVAGGDHVAPEESPPAGAPAEGGDGSVLDSERTGSGEASTGESTAQAMEIVVPSSETLYVPAGRLRTH